MMISLPLLNRLRTRGAVLAADTYLQPYTGRYVFSDATPVAAWQVLPFGANETRQVVTADGWGGAVVRTRNALYWMQETVRPQRVTACPAWTAVVPTRLLIRDLMGQTVGTATVQRVDSQLNVPVDDTMQMTAALDAGLLIARHVACTVVAEVSERV